MIEKVMLLLAASAALAGALWVGYRIGLSVGLERGYVSGLIAGWGGGDQQAVGRKR